MAEIAIEYCVPCELLDPALGVQQTLLTEFGRDLDAVALVPGGGGVFEIRVDGEPIFDGQEEAFEESQLLAEVRDRLPEEATA